jgi:1,2-diacylglycerol 3-alpha-glucosyltransferase
MRNPQTRSLRLVIVSQTYNVHQNGQGVFAVHLAEGLARLGHRVLVVAPSDRVHTYCRLENGVQVQGVTAIPVVFIRPDVHFTPLPGLTVQRTLDDFQPQLVHVQDHYPLCRSAVKAAVDRKIPLVATNHFLPENIVDEVSLFRLVPEVVSPVLWRTVLDVFNQTNVVTTPTETAASILRQQDLRVPVHAISCGVDLEHFRPDPDVDCAAMRERYGLDPERTVFLFVGRIDREKRLDVLVHALQRLDRDDIQLAIAGHGVLREELEHLAGDLLADRRVVFTGFVPNEDLVALLNSADIFAMPSDAELQSIATLEAMATGRPVLAANARALPELVHDGVNGYLFEHGNPDDAARCMTLLADRRADWPAMSAASLEIVRPHNLANTISRYEELYREVLAQGSPT